MGITVARADYLDAIHARAIPALLNAYAMDPMGGGKPLADAILRDLVSSLASLPHAFSVLAFVDGEPAGLVNCFEGFSTFACRPLINIHDIVVLKEFRGLGIGRRMLALVERIARERGCCKLTLEVLEGNAPARAAYARFGFAGYELDPAMGRALFLQKAL